MTTTKSIGTINRFGENRILGNVFGLCVRWGFPALKLIDSTNFKFYTND